MCSRVRLQRSGRFQTLLHATCSKLFQINGSGSICIACICSMEKIRRCSFRCELIDDPASSQALSATGSFSSLAQPEQKKPRILHLMMLECRNMGSYAAGLVGSAWSMPIPELLPLTKRVTSLCGDHVEILPKRLKGNGERVPCRPSQPILARSAYSNAEAHSSCSMPLSKAPGEPKISTDFQHSARPWGHPPSNAFFCPTSTVPIRPFGRVEAPQTLHRSTRRYRVTEVLRYVSSNPATK